MVGKRLLNLRANRIAKGGGPEVLSSEAVAGLEDKVDVVAVRLEAADTCFPVFYI